MIGPGSVSWAALHFGGFHPALALVPIVPFMPHGPRNLELFDPREELQADTLNQFEYWWATPVQFVLLLFGFANAGVPFEHIGPGTYYVLAALLFGKPIGILLFSGCARLIGARLIGARLPQGLHVPTCSWSESPPRSGLPSRCSLRPPPFPREQRWQRQEWARS